MTSSKIDRDGGSPAVTLSTLLSSPAWSLWRSPSPVALARAVFVGHRILRGTSVTLFARPACAEYGVPRPVDNTSPGLPRMRPHSRSWQWKKEEEGVCVCVCVCVFARLNTCVVLSGLPHVAQMGISH